MIAQPLFDALADALVERGEPVTYTSLQKALQADRGRGTSDRDLQAPFADWRERRRYKPYLAALDLPEAMEKAVVELAVRAIRIGPVPADVPGPAAARLPYAAGTDMLLDRIANLEESVACLARENRALRAEIAAMRAGPEAPPNVVPARRRKSGTSAATSRFFWQRIMREFARKIRADGPQSLDQLLASITEDDLALARTAFRPIDARVLRKALAERTRRGRHGLTALGDDRYGLVRAGHLAETGVG